MNPACDVALSRLQVRLAALSAEIHRLVDEQDFEGILGLASQAREISRLCHAHSLWLAEVDALLGPEEEAELAHEVLDELPSSCEGAVPITPDEPLHLLTHAVEPEPVSGQADSLAVATLAPPELAEEPSDLALVELVETSESASSTNGVVDEPVQLQSPDPAPGPSASEEPVEPIGVAAVEAIPASVKPPLPLVEDTLRNLCAETREFEPSARSYEESRHHLRALACRWMGLWSLIRARGEHHRYEGIVGGELRELAWMFRSIDDHPPFSFQLSGDKAARYERGTHDQWELLAKRYEESAGMWQAVDEAGTLEDQRRAIKWAEYAAAKQALLFRAAFVLRVEDPMFSQFQKRIRDIVGEDHHIKSWKLVENGGPADAALERQLATFEEYAAHQRVSEVTRATRKEAKEELVRLLKSDPGDLGFFDELNRSVQKCLDAGIPPSDKGLAQALAPYRAFLTGNGQMSRLVENLGREAMMLVAKHRVQDEPSFSDAEHERKLEELLKVTEGKTMLLMGGNKGQATRKDELKRALKLKQLHWPDSESDSNPAIFDAPMRKSDIVALIVRFSRHAYQGKYREAVEQGCMGVMLIAGLGIHRVVHDMHSQLVRG